MTDKEGFAPLSSERRADNLHQTMHGRSRPVWVFAYGSLLWQPSFQETDRKLARLRGYRRSFCLWSALARGSPDQMGLGLGLIKDGNSNCEGIVLMTEPSSQNEQLTALWDREMWTDAYIPGWQKLETSEGQIDAIVFEANRQSRQFAGEMSDWDAAQIISRARGKFGTCRDYLEKTYDVLLELGINCPEISRVREAMPPHTELH